MKQGKCDKCKKRLEWTLEIHSRDCFCPSCGTKLLPTNRLLKKWPTIKQWPDDIDRVAYKRRRGFYK